MNTTRATLLQRVKDWGNARAWTEFDRIYRPILLRFARRRGLDPTEAEEAAQLVMVRVARKISKFVYDPRRGYFRGWLLRLAENQISDLIAKRRNFKAGSAVLLHLTDGQTPETLFEAIWREEHVRHCLSLVRHEVEESTYRAFCLHVLEELPVEQVCLQLGVTANQVYKARWRITRKLAERFREFPDAK